VTIGHAKAHLRVLESGRVRSAEYPCRIVGPRVPRPDGTVCLQESGLLHRRADRDHPPTGRVLAAPERRGRHHRNGAREQSAPRRHFPRRPSSNVTCSFSSLPSRLTTAVTVSPGLLALRAYIRSSTPPIECVPSWIRMSPRRNPPRSAGGPVMRWNVNASLRAATLVASDTTAPPICAAPAALIRSAASDGLW